jgi:predicted DsbA family dithiol-disulfide isomerase
VRKPEVREYAVKADVKVIPTLLFIDGKGNVNKTITGAQPKNVLEDELKKIIK